VFNGFFNFSYHQIPAAFFNLPRVIQVVVWTLVRRDSAIYGAQNKNYE